MLKASEHPELTALTKPIKERFIEPPPSGKQGHYVPHFVISQIILASVGPFDWELVETLRGTVPAMETKGGKSYPELENAIIGAVYRMTVTVDGQKVTIEETGSCEAAAYENNDAERLKKASSDAIKRCAMRLGVGIHLWCKRTDQYIVHASLLFNDQEGNDPVKVEAPVGVEEAEAEAEAEE